jgi:hypothetical protein
MVTYPVKLQMSRMVRTIGAYNQIYNLTANQCAPDFYPDFTIQ